MHSTVYIITMFFVMVGLIALPLFPFWKVWRRLKAHHPDIWEEKGPFDIRTMTSYGTVFSSFIGFISTAGQDESLKAKDAELVSWCNGAREVIRMMPKSFLGQVGYVMIFIYFVFFFTTALLGLFT